MAPSVSVIVPTFERRELVQRAVASVLAQSYRDFELIVVDDGSTDGTRGAIEPLPGPVRYLWQENGGTSAARNAGLAVARGDIVAFLDSDDRWLPDHLGSIAAILSRYPAAVLAGTTPGFLAAGRAAPDRARLVEPFPRLLIANDVGYASSVALRRSALDSVGGFGEGLEPAEYSDLLMRVALLGPFALLRRRTIVPQQTTGSMLDRGRESGRYLEVLCGISQRAAEATRGRPAGEQAAGARRFFDGLAALNAGRAEHAREALLEACSRFPELSSEPVLVGRQVINAMPGDRLAVFSALAGLWPAPASETAGALRVYAIGSAVREGRVGEAGRLLRGLRRTDARLLVTRRRDVGQIVRRTAAGLAHRGRESALLKRS